MLQVGQEIMYKGVMAALPVHAEPPNMAPPDKVVLAGTGLGSAMDGEYELCSFTDMPHSQAVLYADPDMPAWYCQTNKCAIYRSHSQKHGDEWIGRWVVKDASGHTRFRTIAHDEPLPPATASDSRKQLAEVLSVGCGPVLLDRRGRHGSRSTRLWVTPGVRGVWVPGASVPDGEVVELLSTTQLSEGGEGEFVRIRRAAEVGGHEGWTKLKNIYLQTAKPNHGTSPQWEPYDGKISAPKPDGPDGAMVVTHQRPALAQSAEQQLEARYKRKANTVWQVATVLSVDASSIVTVLIRDHDDGPVVLDKPKPAIVLATDCAHLLTITQHSELLHLQQQILQSEQAGQRCTSSHDQLKAALSKVAEYLEQQNAALTPIEQLMDPAWDRVYGPGETHWHGAIDDGHDRGGEPYYCPSGWKRYGIRVPDFETNWSGSNIVYHGSRSGLASDILHAGFKGGNGDHCDGKEVAYFSPSILYAAHARYAKVWERTQGGKTQYYQMVLQCRVKPNAVMKKANETLGATCKVDPNYDNDVLEWLVRATVNDGPYNIFVDKDKVLLYGIMVRITDVHPGDLAESQWEKKHWKTDWNKWG